MIISHKHKFIFFKTRKTAGSSIQVSLAKQCGENDIITGQYREGIDDNSHTTGLNMDKFWTIHPHPTLLETKQFLGEDIWESYFKFGFVRNPFDIAVSRYHWNMKGKSNQTTSIDGFRNWVKTGGLEQFDELHNYLCYNGKIDVDFIGLYENLQEDYDQVCDHLNLEKQQLSKMKVGFRDSKRYIDFYDDESQQIVHEFYKKDLDLFDYKFNQKIKTRKLTPIIKPEMMKTGGDNINGPSLIKVPEWVNKPLGKYYLYFAHHQGKYIRLAYSDYVTGPYTIYEPGTLKLEDTISDDHIASPDVHIDNENKKILMYYHGDEGNGSYEQSSYLASSDDGINFKSDNKVLGSFYFRVFKYKDKFYSFAKNKNIDGVFYESDDGKTEFKKIFNFIDNVRHSATLVHNDSLFLFYTLIGDAPEKIYCIEVVLNDTYDKWVVKNIEVVHEPTEEYEGANLQVMKSQPGSSTLRYGGPVNEIRDPYVFKDDDKFYLLYSIKGELGIAISKLLFL